MSFTLSRKTSSGGSIRWIVPNLIVRNDVNLFDGRKSCGKSSVVSAILGDWNVGKDMWGEDQLRNILWLSSEEPFDSVIKPRLMQYGIEEEKITTIDYKNAKSVKPVLPNDLDKLCQFITANNVNALVIDPFSELKPTEWSINDGDQMRSYMTSIVGLCSRTQCTAFVMRHMRKSNGNFSGDDGIGSVQTKASIRHPLRIDVTEEKIKRRFLSVEESNIARPMLPLQFGFEDKGDSFGKLVWMGHKDIAIDEIKKLAESKVKRSKLEDAKILLMESLKDGEKSSKLLYKEAMDYGIGDRTLDDAKADLGVTSTRKTDSATGMGHWVWSLPVEPIITAHQEKDMPQFTLEDLTPEPAKVEPIHFDYDEDGYAIETPEFKKKQKQIAKENREALAKTKKPRTKKPTKQPAK